MYKLQTIAQNNRTINKRIKIERVKYLFNENGSFFVQNVWKVTLKTPRYTSF